MESNEPSKTPHAKEDGQQEQPYGGSGCGASSALAWLKVRERQASGDAGEDRASTGTRPAEANTGSAPPDALGVESA